MFVSTEGKDAFILQLKLKFEKMHCMKHCEARLWTGQLQFNANEDNSNVKYQYDNDKAYQI